MWKSVLEEGMRARGGRDSCHTVTNASLCERTLGDEGLMGGRPPSPHSCHRPVTQNVIVPPHLDWIMGLLVRVGISRTSAVTPA